MNQWDIEQIKRKRDELRVLYIKTTDPTDKKIIEIRGKALKRALEKKMEKQQRLVP